MRDENTKLPGSLEKPEPIWLSLDAPERVYGFLEELGLIPPGGPRVSLSTAGAGNMNVTLRVVARGESGPHSWIVKQSRPFVAKYDSIQAPIDRIDYERFFYDFIQQHPTLAQRMPKMLASVPEQYTIVLEDLGEASDLQNLYHRDHDNTNDVLPSDIEELFAWMVELHARSRGSTALAAFGNLELRKLNHQHIFVVSFSAEPALDLEQVCGGLTEASLGIRTDPTLKKIIKALGERYLGAGECLLHGDFYPGSWLATEHGVRVIDPEFSFAGPAEFDVGVMLGHLCLAGFSSASEQLQELGRRLGYHCDWRLAIQFAGVEILRRILGVAQLPLERSLEEFSNHLEVGQSMILQGSAH